MGAASILANTVFIFAWICSARSFDCSNNLRTSCSSLGVNTFVVTEIQPTTQLVITCDVTSVPLSGWSLSPDGSLNPTLLNTSSTKYTVDSNTLTINNIDKTDEGLYRCVYQLGGSEGKKCIYVYGRAVFASCLLDFARCTENPTQLSVTAGGSVNLNATITHIRGGSCGFEQEITLVQLRKINDGSGDTNQLLLSCPTSSNTCSYGRLSLDRGRDPGIEFVFTLSNANANDAGVYEVAVEVKDPGAGSQTSIEKRFHIEVNSTTEAILPGTMVAATTPGSVTHSSSNFTATTYASDSNLAVDGKNEINIIWVIISPIILAIILLVILLLVIMFICKCIKRREKLIGGEMEVPPIGLGGQNPVPHHNSEAVLNNKILNNMEFKIAQPHQIVNVQDNCQNETDIIASPVYETIPKANNHTRNLSNHNGCIESHYNFHNNIVLKNEFLNSPFKDV